MYFTSIYPIIAVDDFESGGRTCQKVSKSGTLTSKPNFNHDEGFHKACTSVADGFLSLEENLVQVVDV